VSEERQDPAIAGALDPGRPALRIVHGNPTPEEIAAVTVVLTIAANAAAEQEAPEPIIGGWSDPHRRLRRPLPAGPGAWRASAWT
jgi:acyl-CoA carboxylase epsilon subunit